MNRTELLAIGAGLVAGYLLIMYLNRRETAAKAAAPRDRMQTLPVDAVPDWAAGDKTLTDIWNGTWKNF